MELKSEITSLGSTVMVVEDNEDLRENAVLVLTLENYSVVAASDGQEALDMLTTGQCQPDLIVSDIAMPRLDGYGFFEAVRNMPALRSIPFIFLTARGSRRDIRFGKELGADDYLVKPFNAEDFLVAVRNKLKRTKEIREGAENDLDDARRAMVQLMSHELRTPLTYVTGGFSLLAEGLEHENLPTDMQLSMGLIRSGTDRLNHLAEQLVIYAELISGHTKIQLEKLGEPLNVVEIVKEAMSLVERDAKSRSVIVALNSRLTHTVRVFTVADLLRYPLYEVLRNAINYSNSESEIQVTLHQDGNEVVIMIVDQGRGIPAEDQTKIWDIMVQSERAKHEQQGAGMGLPIVKQMLLAHGGKASLISEPQAGTTVILRLPIYQGASEVDS